MNDQVIKVNLIPNMGTPAVVRVSQYDVGRPLLFKVLDGTSAIAMPSGTTATIEGTKPSGLGFSVTGTLSVDTVTVNTTIDMTQESGMIPAEIRFTQGTTDIGTANFILNVEKTPHAEGTTDGTQDTMQNLEARLQTEISSLKEDLGDLEDLETTDKSNIVKAINEAAQSGGGSGSDGIAVVSLASEMTDTSSVYLYNGTETGYTAGHWYFWNTGTSRWTDGGQYTGWETVDTALENFLDENAQEMGVLTVVVGSTTYTYNGSANVSITLPTYNGGVS